jgi:hypothetical protein
MTFFGYLIAFLQQYVVPLIFAIGLIFLIYGIIEYFILGPSEEPTRDAGRLHFIKAFVWFLGGLVVYFFVSLLIFGFTWLAQFSVETGSEEDLLNVPNAPESRQ